MSKVAALSTPTGRLTLGDVLRMLVNDGLVDKVHAEKLYKDRKLDSSNLHPLVIIGEQKWKSLKAPHKAITVEILSQWLAHRANLDYYHIDPLKLDFGSAAQIVSKGYAERLRIMPISTKNGEAVIATTEPYSTDWIVDLERVLKMKIKLVVANPLEISRY
nr:type II/IV secretion system protein [Methylotenera sp.]